MKFDLINENILKNGLEKDLYLFKIVNKDLLSKSKNSKNTHTLYWEALFSDINCNNINLALSAGAEVFYREGQKGVLKKKFDNKNKEVLDAKRYAENKYFFHTPITINYGKPKLIKFKDLLQIQIAKYPKQITYLGLDRGEKHLVYYCLVDYQGKIIKQGSFNKLIVAGKEVDFHQKLTEKSGNRDKARKDWETIGNIKNFKEGYLSQVIHEIYKIVIENNAIIVLENLNTEFKAKRTAKVEKSVYKKFELALAKKLNHLVLKDRAPIEKGGVLNAYQLTPIIGSGDVGKYEKFPNWGIIKKVHPAYTSAVDPLTGWHKHIYISNSATEKEVQALFGVDGKVQINYDFDQKCYRFDYTQEITEAKIVVNTKSWQLHAHKDLERFRWNPTYSNSDGTKGKIEKQNVYKKLNELFDGFDKNISINEQIFDKPNFKWKSLVFYWNLLNQIRNTDQSIDDDSADFIQSPAWFEKLESYFDSRKASSGKYIDYENKYGELPKNGDANGAYHIAKRGLEL